MTDRICSAAVAGDALASEVQAYFESGAWLHVPYARPGSASTVKRGIATCHGCGAPYLGSYELMRHDDDCPVARLVRAHAEYGGTA